MAAMTTSSNTMSEQLIITRLKKDYPQFKFVRGGEDHWSAKTGTITYNPGRPDPGLSYSILHELAHALLGHTDYRSDFELLKLESEAWQLASKLGPKYKVKIDQEHIQSCLDTYRDWLHRRSACPRCGTHTLQADAKLYHCYNCQTNWRVTSRRFARPYRKLLLNR
jgi:hypothetical protein